MNARFNDDQRTAVTPFLYDARVHDLGAADLYLAHELVFLGAKHVLALDRNPMPKPETDVITCQQVFFEVYQGDVDVAFMGYPANWRTGLAVIAARARIVIYLGKNTDCTSCGSHELFEHLAGREVLAHVPDQRNTLIVYGPKRVYRPRLPEEHAKLTENEKMWTWDELLEWKP